MKRVLRILVNAATAISLLAFLLVLFLWVAGYWYCHQVYLGNDRGTSGLGFDARSTPGALECVLITFESEPGRTAAGVNASFEADAWPTSPNLIRHREWVRAGFGVHRWEQLPKSTIPGPKYANYYFGFALPFWLLAILFAIAPVLRWNPRRIRRRRRLAGLCPTCGYNLTGNTSGVCPECGTAIKT